MAQALPKGAQALPVEPDWSLEAQLWARGCSPVAGVDEAGRGALAGPVVAAAVILPLGTHPYRDSKTLPPERREELAANIRCEALAWAVGIAEPAEIDELNVLRATHLAAGRALVELRRTLPPGGLVTDYLWLEERAQVLPVAQADCRSYQAAAAGILAKVTRDELMRALALEHPEYGFEQNKGYGAPAHLQALEAVGPCRVHRASFAPVTRTLASSA
ncbi:MAG TPA: ribonuclease HII [Trueperaceae bacterium]